MRSILSVRVLRLWVPVTRLQEDANLEKRFFSMINQAFHNSAPIYLYAVSSHSFWNSKIIIFLMKFFSVLL